MYLTISKRFEFSSSRFYHDPERSLEENVKLFGRDAAAEHGSGQNYTAYFVFSGPVDSATGMVINVVTIKERAGEVINSRYDHKFLNVDTRPFDGIVPSPENIARHLLDEVMPLFEGETARPVACHLTETDWRGATAYADGRVESQLAMEFSAARQTYSPHLSEKQNQDLFGRAASPAGHGHRYRLRVTLTGEVNENTGMIAPDEECRQLLAALHKRFDHRHLNLEVPELQGVPMTTECLARHFHKTLAADLPVARVRLDETSDFFVEYHGENRFRMGVVDGFNAAHRLHSPVLSESENLEVFGKCNNLFGHGHFYRVEAAMAGPLDERSGTLMPLPDLQSGVRQALDPWDHKHLNLDTSDFDGVVSTSENMIDRLWPRVNDRVGDRLWRLRLWETPNNRFTLRRDQE